VKAINHCDVGKSCRAVGEEMGVGRTQIMNILKRKGEILDNFENNASSSTSCSQALVTGKKKYIPCDNKSASHWMMFDYFFHV
jgi:hypothetical protein